jgi:hypothetical protein
MAAPDRVNATLTAQDIADLNAAAIDPLVAAWAVGR